MTNDTLASMFWRRLETGSSQAAQLVKRDGAWCRLTWSEVGNAVRELASGLVALGRRPGDAVAILAASRAEWVQADFAILSAGCTTVPIYPTYTPQQIADILNECEVRTLFVEDQMRLSRVLEVRDKLTDLEQIVLIEGPDARTPLVLTWEELRRRGLAHVEIGKSLLGGRLRFAVSGGAPLSREVAEFFHAVGLLIVEGYGLTEACPALTFNRITDFKFGSVGQAIPGVELQIAPDGEVLARGPNISRRGYCKRPEDTTEVFGPGDWLHTGDIGHLDDEGFRYLTDRKKDLIVTSGGINIAPQFVEQLLRRDAFIADAMLYGDRRPYPTALIVLNPEEVARFARQHGLLVSEYAQLMQHPLVMARLKAAVEATNAQLQSYAQIKKFAVIPGELTEPAGELTPTQKMRRQVVATKYHDILEALYR